ncbi:suppressor of fused domain protein [Leptospira wolffii]|uniref:Suppressor of fused domain protein n=1 Tax=Leptospira wolffii TaxID=409998 RepID=A0ABV5BJ54_9LEPT|nr:suppressor of fused domain protein [Leptospira wolffii]EPG65561.1 suppressor of fused protein [Leptospira wolffii serovar Khorat str. Khorat-H2]TGL54237.1 suppressor of fused domain protein [Leptospira wolffii]
MNRVLEPKILYQEANPYGAFTAYLEDDGRTIYLYLQAEESPDFAIKSVWVCNRIDAPKERSQEDLRNGLAPLLLEAEVTDPKGQPEFDVNEIHFIWSEEGNGVSFFYKEELFAYLPPWSGVKGFHGYSKFAKVEAITAYPLGNSEFGVIPDRIAQDRKFWEYRSTKGIWKEIQESRLGFLESAFGKHDKYWSADGGKYPQLGIARFAPKELPGVYVYSTIGMSAQNLPGVELYRKDYEDYSRVELLLAAKISDEDRSESWVPHQIGEIIRFPWTMGKWFGHGHTISMSRKDPESLYLSFTHLALREIGSEEGFPALTGLKSEKGKEIRFLALLPISEEERIFLQDKGVSAFFSLFDTFGTKWIHNPERHSAV